MTYCINHTGRRFGSLVAVEPTYKVLSSGRKVASWRLRCDCGKEVVAITSNLTKGKHQSCGCQRTANIEKKRQRVGVAKMPEYRVYRQMLDRCYRESARNFQWYGAKGVRVCDRWRHGEGGRDGFLCFLSDMGPRPDGMTLDRVDPFKDYEPANCRWATWAVQGANKRKHHLCTKGGADDTAVICLYTPNRGI